jgi:hypothetical protein
MQKRKPETSKRRALAERALETVRAWLRGAIAQAHRLHPHAAKALEAVKPWWIACTSKLRAYAGNALENLKTRFPVLAVYAGKLRLNAARLLEAVHGRYRAGVAYIGKRSPRTAKAIEACETWLRHNWRRLALGALAAVFVLGIGFAAIFPETAGRYCRVIFTSSRVVPLPDETHRAVHEKAKQLAEALDRRLERKRKLAGEAWTSAQILVALRENDPDYASRIDVKLIEQYFRSAAGPECACWRRFPQGKYPNHIGVTSWVLWAFARYGIPAHKSELEFLLSTQGSDGGWPLFAGAQQEKQQEKFVSSYGTAAAILALHAQSTLQPDPEQKKRLAAAVQRGADWLKSGAVAERARWVDYPAWAEAKEESLGVSGFALFALHRVGTRRLGALDRYWLRELPAQAPAALEGETSAKMVQVGKRSYRDDTRYHGLPWTIAATMLVYRDTSISRKVRALEWLERALAPGGSIYALTGREKNAAIAAESLLALRNEAKGE